LIVGQLDAAVVYKANAIHITDKADIIPLPIDGAVATQTVAIAQQTRYPQLLQRLETTLQTTQSHDLFITSGFEWIAPDLIP
jgi:hypothetical protein